MMHSAAVQYYFKGSFPPGLTQEEQEQIKKYIGYLKGQSLYFNGQLFLEYPLASHYQGLSSGRCDALIIGFGVAKIVDFKTGDGENKILSAEGNEQLKAYALFVCDAFPNVNVVKVTIYNAATGRYKRDVTYTRGYLYYWRNHEVIPALQRMHAGQAACTPGAHCKYCSCRKECEPRVQFYTDLLKLFDHPELMTRDDDLRIAANATELHAFIEERRDIVQPLIDAGNIPPEYEVVPGNKFRILTDKGRQMIHERGWTEKKNEPKDKTLVEMTKEFGEGFMNFLSQVGGITMGQNRTTLKQKKSKKYH